MPQAGEILIKNHAVATNPADWLIQKLMDENGPFISKYPVVLGCDLAGTVEEVKWFTCEPILNRIQVGEGVTRFKKGDKVCVASGEAPFNLRKGAFQEFSITTENRTFMVINLLK